VAELTHAGIAGALVHHGVARDYDPAAGNRLLLDELAALDGPAGSVAPDSPTGPAGRSALIPCATLLPPATGEFPPPAEALDALAARGVRAVRLYPRSHTFSLSPWCSGPLLDELERRRIPVSIDLAETDWETLHAVAARHPALPLIVTRVNYRQERMLYALWEHHANLRVELSLFQSHRGIEEAVARFGAGRLLFGTGLPFFDAGAPILMLARCEIAPEARAAIAGGNLRALLRLERPAPAGPEGSAP
jgi:hypothetical protein